MIDIDALKRDKRPQSSTIVHALIDRLEAAESEAIEQARLNGMGSEREATLMAKLEAAEKSDAESLAMYRRARDERDELRAKIEATEEDRSRFLVEMGRLCAQRDALRAKIAEMEKTWLSPEGYHILMQEREDMLFQAEKMKQHAPCKDISMWPTHHTQPTQPAPSVPEGWLRAIDEALIVAHIGIANAHDTYEQAKAKLDNLIGLHVDIATDPAVNGGWKLMPAASTCEMDIAGASHCDGYLSVAAAVWDAMFEAAPEAKQ